MKFSDKQYQLIIVVLGVIVLALLCLQFGLGDIMKASFEGEKSEDEVWTNLNVEYRNSLYAPTAIITADFHNNKMFETFDDYDGDIYHATYNFTRFDFRLRSVEDTSAYPYGLRSYSEDNVELPRGESYNVRFYVRDDLVEGEPIKVELTAQGYEEDGRRKVIEEKLSFTLEPPIYSEPESEKTPGFTSIFTLTSILFVIYIIRKGGKLI